MGKWSEIPFLFLGSNQKGFPVSLNVLNSVIKTSMLWRSSLIPLSFDKLKDLINSHDKPSIALGDFNLTNKDDNKFNIYKGQEDFWYVAHREGCNSCKGTYYYGRGNSWDFLDTIMVSKERGISFDNKTINVFKTEFNTYRDTGKPFWFDSEKKQGISDHFPIVAEVNIN